MIADGALRGVMRQPGPKPGKGDQLTETRKRGRKHSGMIKIVLRISPEMYAAIPGNRTAYIRDATKRQMVEDGLLEGYQVAHTASVIRDR